jgi:hypothetical protein
VEAVWLDARRCRSVSTDAEGTFTTARCAEWRNGYVPNRWCCHIPDDSMYPFVLESGEHDSEPGLLVGS